MKLSEATYKDLREYQEELLERVRCAPCPACGAVRGARCVSRYPGRTTKGCHADRHTAAKHEGFVFGHGNNKRIRVA